MGFKAENIYEFNDCNLKEINEGHLKLLALIRDHGKAKERVFVYCYAAGHGGANVR